MRKLFLITLLLFQLGSQVFAQKKLDSLQSLLLKTNTDSIKILIFIKIGNECIYSDSLKSLNSFKKAYELSNEISSKIGIAHSLRNLGFFYDTYGDYLLANEYYKNALNAFIESKNRTFESACLNDLGMVSYYQGDFTNALRYFQKSIVIDQELGDQKNISASYINIGSIHENLNNLPVAEMYFKKALEIKQKIADKNGISSCYLSIGNIALRKENFPKAISYYKKALELKKVLNDKKGISKCYNNIGITYSKSTNNFNALSYYHKALDLFIEMDDKPNIIGCLLNIANSHLEMKHPKEALLATDKGFKLAQEINSNHDLLNIYGIYAGIYAFEKDYQKAYQYQLIYDTIKNKVNNEEITRVQQEMEATFQNKQKQKEIELQNIELSKQTTQKYAITVGLCLVILLLVVITIAFTQKRKANFILSKQKNEIQEKNEELYMYFQVLNKQKTEIQEKNEELLQQNEEIVTQRDELEIQKLLVDNQNKEITDSIHYAKRIQTAILPPKQIEYNKNIPEHFFLFKPRDIVSGDFYWINHIENELANSKGFLITAAVDCTGHGVPGAFMSMLGVSFLSEIVNKSQIQTIKASQILDQLRDKVIAALHQTGKDGEQKDGMDIALCIINLDNLIMQYAGAFSPLYIIKKQEESLNDIIIENQLIEIKADKMPIGIYYRNTPSFTNHEIQLQKGDCVYIFTDGYADQFNAVNGKKLKYKLFKEILIKANLLCMKEQKAILDEKFEKWKGSHRQIDDVLVIGVRV